MIQEIIAEIRSSKPYDVFYAHSLLALCGHIEAQAKELAELKDEASQQPAWGLDQVRQIIEERDRLKAELQQGYQDYDALRIQKDNEIRALKTEVEEWKAGSKAEADAGENTGLRAEVARLQKEIAELNGKQSVRRHYKEKWEEATVERDQLLGQLQESRAEVARLQKEMQDEQERCRQMIEGKVFDDKHHAETIAAISERQAKEIAQLTRERDSLARSLEAFRK